MKKYCTRCEQYKVIQRSMHIFTVAGATLLTGFIFLIIFFPIGIPLMLAGLIGMIAAPFAKGTYCENCKQVIK